MIWAIVLLFLLSAFFSGSETALLSMNRLKLYAKLENNAKHERLLFFLLKHLDSVIGSLLVGNNLVNVLLAVLFTHLFSRWWQDPFVISLLTMGVLTPLLLFFGEILPKIVAKELYTLYLKLFGWLIFVVFLLLLPVQFLFHRIITTLLWMVGIRRKREIFSRDEFESLIHMAEQSGELRKSEKDFIESVVNFKNVKVKEIMVPLIRMSCVEENDSVQLAAALMITTKHTRIPVFKMRVDNMVGYLDHKDILNKPSEDPVKKYIKKAIFIPDTVSITQALLEMQRHSVQMLFIVDEYGGVVGAVTNHDIIGEIVGNWIDSREEMFHYENGVWHVNGMANIDDVNDIVGTKIEKQDFETIAGYLLTVFGRIPTVGDSYEDTHFTFEIEHATATRIVRIKIQPKRNKKIKGRKNRETSTIR
ncbi:MAG: HlyC/CorC family transporter [Brevinematales bacterium]|nr:HlyC/CorC family transporter [Brevinematales bacterium]